MANLSFERLALVLALTGCSKATPAVDTQQQVRSDPAASAQAAPPPMVTATAAAISGSAAPTPAPGGAASALETRKKMGDGHTGQASCGAGSCTSEIKKK